MWEALVERERGFRLFSDSVLTCVRQARLLILGLGGNGSVCDLLLRAGFTNFCLLDGDKVEATNLNRLPFGTDFIGLPKVEAFRRHLLSINPDAQVQTFERFLTRHDGNFLRELLAGTLPHHEGKKIDLVFLGTTDVEANLVAGRICAEEHVRMIIGPSSSGCWIVGTFLHRPGDVTVESLGGFGTEKLPLTDIDYEQAGLRYSQLMNYPGRKSRLEKGVWESMVKGELPARSAGLFVRMTNAAQAFEAVKNIADLNGLPVDGTAITPLPRVQIFDPYVGASCYYDIEKRRIGIPDWLKGEIDWRPIPEPLPAH